MLLHAADRLGGNLHGRPRRRPQPRRRPDRAAGDKGRHRPRRRFRRKLASHCAGGGPRKQARALVVARQGTPPLGPNDPEAIKATVHRADYDRQDCWTLSLPSSRPVNNVAGATAISDNGDASASEPVTLDVGPWHIRVYSVIDLDGSRSISPGLEPSAATILPGPNPEVTVSYVLKRPWLPGLPWSVAFRTEPPGSVVPPMVLVAHHRAVPLSVDDGQIVAVSRPAATVAVPYPHAVQPLPVRYPGFPRPQCRARCPRADPPPSPGERHHARLNAQARDAGRSRALASTFRLFCASFDPTIT